MIMQLALEGTTVTVPVPDHSEVAIGTLRSIIRQSGLPRGEFEPGKRKRKKGNEQQVTFSRASPCVFALASHSLCVGLLVRLTRGSHRTHPVYKNPLDVTVDEKGEFARVVLTGPRTVAVVDLKAGRVVKEEAWPRVTIGFNAEYSQRLSRAVYRTGDNETSSIRVDRLPRPNLPVTQVTQVWAFANGSSWAPLCRLEQFHHRWEVPRSLGLSE